MPLWQVQVYIFVYLFTRSWHFGCRV